MAELFEEAIKYYETPSYVKYMPKWLKCLSCPHKLFCKLFNQPLCLKKVSGNE